MEHYYYTYDKLHRLILETTSTGSAGVSLGVFSMNYDDPEHIHAVSSVTQNGIDYAYSYDANGNQQSGPDLTDPINVVQRGLAFNADSMATQIAHPSGGTINLIYDGENTRAKKTGPNGTTYYFSKEFEIINNVETCYIFAGNLRVAMVKDHQSASTTYFHKDHLGSSTVLTRADGSVIETTRYMPYGGKRGGGTGITATSYKFTDQELDAESGLYNYDARLYDPIIGKFVSADTIVQDWFDSQSFNRFAYCRNNPLKYKDPDGHFIVSAAVVVGGVVAAKLGGLVVGYLGVKAAVEAATINTDPQTQQNVNKSVDKALASTAKISGVSTAASLGTAAGAVAVSKGYTAASTLTVDKVAIAVMSAAQKPQIAKTIDTVINLPETLKNSPDKVKEAAKKANDIVKELVEQMAPENESGDGNETNANEENGETDNNSNGDPDKE